MIKLTQVNYIAQGTNRACYIHPLDNTKCIKVTISNDYRESNKEIKYYKFLESKNISWVQISKYYGSILTNKGQGEIFDLIRDYDGSISKTLSYYLQTEELTRTILNPKKLLFNLKEYTLKENIVVKDLNTKNMMYQKIDENNARLILVDGIYNNSFLFYSNFFPFLAQRKINKLWDNFESSLFQKYKNNNYFITLFSYTNN